MKRRMIAIVVAITMIITSGVVYADEVVLSGPVSENAVDNNASVEQEDAFLLESVGVNPDALSLQRIGEADGVYQYTIGQNIIGIVKVEELKNEDVQIEYCENGVSDILLFRKNGDLYVNDKLVEFEPADYSYEDIDSDGEEVIEPNGRVSVFSKSPQKGKASDYTKYVSTYKTASINAKQKIKNLTVAAITTIISTAIRTDLRSNIGLAVLGNIGTNLKSTAEKYAPNSAYFSYKVNKYAYKSNSNTDKYYKHSGLYYVKKNLQGYATANTFYEYNYIQ